MIQKIRSQEKWDKAVKNLGGQFLQSWQWGEFQKSLGHFIWPLALISSNQNIVNLSLICQYKLPLGLSYFYSPRGPIGDYKPFLEKIQNLAKKEKAIFWRIEPNNSKIDIDKLVSVPDKQPSKTIVLDLTFSLEELLQRMHYKTRYNIRLSQRHQIKVRKTVPETLEKDIELFLFLIHQTAKRDKFKTWPDEYYRKLIKTLFPQYLGLYLAEKNEETLAANIIIFWQKTATYLYGGTSDQKRNLMAPYLLHWHIIKEAKNKGYKNYDFWGIDEKKWPGLTRFKKGFKGKIVNFPGTFDVILNKNWYSLYSLAKKLL